MSFQLVLDFRFSNSKIGQCSTLSLEGLAPESQSNGIFRSSTKFSALDGVSSG